MAELGGKHMQDHKLVHDTPYSVRSSSQRSASPDDAVPKTRTGTRAGSGQASADEVVNEDDEEEDSSNSQDDDDDEPEVFAPSHGRGKGKGKRPSIRVELLDEDEAHSEDEAAAFCEAGLKPGKRPFTHLLTNKKRTFSNVSNTSVLFGDDESEEHAFPRRKMARKLSNSGLKPLLKYKENADDDMDGFENAIETDDEDYSGVNLVPDDDENFEEEEASYLIREEEEQATALISQYNDARRFSLDSHASDDIFNITTPLIDPYGNPPTLDFTQFFEPEPLPASPEPSAKRKYSDSSTKRVRFDDEVQVSDSSSPSSSELDSSLYPDLFLEQDKLPPSLSQLLQEQGDEDNGDYDSPASEVSFWDYGQEDDRLEETEGQSDLSDSDASGYETDLGDTTDEYESDVESLGNPHTPTPKKKSVLHPLSSAPGSKASSPKAFDRSSKGYGRAIPPTRGIFIHDDRSKAIAVTNRTTKTLTFYRPRVSTITWVATHGSKSSSSSTANNSPRTAVHHLNGSDSEVSNEVFSNPFTTDIMLSGIFGAAPGDDFLFGAESIGPPEAFYPFVSIGANGAIEDEADYDDEDSQEDLNIADFMDFGDDADDTDVEQEDEETDVPATPATSMLAMNGSTPAQPTPMMDTPVSRKRNTSDAMLQHFDRGVVTAFRNNQNRYRDLSILPSDPTIRASVSRPVRSGKSAETVMTPLRKRSISKRAARSPFQQSSPMVNASSPLSGVTKASSRLHKQVMNSRQPPKMGTFS